MFKGRDSVFEMFDDQILLEFGKVIKAFYLDWYALLIDTH